MAVVGVVADVGHPDVHELLADRSAKEALAQRNGHEEITLAIGETKTLSAGGVKEYSEGVKGIVDVVPTPSVDGTRKEGTVRLDGARGWRLGPADATDVVAEVVDRMAVAAVVDGVGAAARALELAVDYAKERVQFDRPIGSFQAVQHLCADMLRAVELARAGAYYACWAADAGDDRERHRAATMAKAFASDELYRVGASAVQVFGGLGFTWEHDIHLFLKRVMSLQRVGGGSDEHLEELAHIVLD